MLLGTLVLYLVLRHELVAAAFVSYLGVQAVLAIGRLLGRMRS